MPDQCIPCLSKGIKASLKEIVAEPEVHKMIDEMPTCPSGITLQFCPVDLEGGHRGSRQKKDHVKRAPSAYNIFIKECLGKHDLKGKPFGTAGQFMKECAAEYKAQKGHHESTSNKENQTDQLAPTPPGA